MSIYNHRIIKLYEKCGSAMGNINNIYFFNFFHQLKTVLKFFCVIKPSLIRMKPQLLGYKFVVSGPSAPRAIVSVALL